MVCPPDAFAKVLRVLREIELDLLSVTI